MSVNENNYGGEEAGVPEEVTGVAIEEVQEKDESKSNEEEKIYVHNVWEQEEGCPRGDGNSIIIPSYDPFYRGGTDPSFEETEEIEPGQYLLVSWARNKGWSCCSGYSRASLEVFDEEPDLTGEEYPEEKYGDLYEYNVMTYEELKDEITGY